MRKLLFIDRDGTILKEPEDEQIDSFQKMQFLPHCIKSLARICAETDFELIMVSNQDGLGTKSFPEAAFWPVQELMLNILKGEGVTFKSIYIDRSTAEAPSAGRKPGTEMLLEYFQGDYSLAESFVIGDRYTDLALAKNLGCQGILISESLSRDTVLTTMDWREIADFLISRPRKCRMIRRTSETSIDLHLRLEGTGKWRIDTGLGFLNHMLEQIAKHGNLDLEIICKGDLQVDEHHTVEDVALSLGQAFKEVLGSKKGVERYGYVVPMDDSEARVSLDFGGRPFLNWNAAFKRERIGDVPCELFEHFFKSFSDEARCNLHIEATGTNEHHKIEAIFKSFARALKMAVSKSQGFSVPSTKGVL